MPFIMGGMALMSGVMGAIGGSGEAAAAAMQAKMQQENQNFQNKWQNEASNRNLLRQWQAQQQANIQIEKGANKAFVTQQIYSKKEYQNQTSMMSKQTRQTTDGFLAAVSQRGMSLDSASARSVLRQVANEAKINSEAVRVSYNNQQRDIGTGYQNMLSKMNLGNPEQASFMPSTGGIVDSSSSVLMTGIATSAFGAASAGYGAHRANVKAGV